MTSRPCDYCKLATAAMYCHADAAFLCAGCDENVHATTTTRHVRVPLCEVCEQAPAHVTCKADAAVLCAACDRDIHSANPLARRHERFPVAPLPDYYPAFDNSRRFSEVEEAEAASWILPDSNAGKSRDESLNTGQYVFSEMDPYLDLEYSSVDPKKETTEESSGTDGVVPEESKFPQSTPIVSYECFDFDFPASKAYHGGYSCISTTVSSSSPDIGVVPDGGSMAEISNPNIKAVEKGTETVNLISAVQLSSAEREARVLRYREKRKNRKFEKTIRYASRKAYAEKRPRIKGRFAKRPEAGAGGASGGGGGIYGGYDVVPSF